MKKISIILIAILILAGCTSVEQSDIVAPNPEQSNPPQQINETEQKSLEMLNAMTLEEKVGQMFFVRCKNEKMIPDIEQYHLGGIILFATDTKDETLESLTSKIKSYQDASKIEILIGVDEEGGTVNRISKYPQYRATPFLSPQQLYNNGGFDRIIEDTKEKSQLLKSLGFNMNLAPVCDISTNKNDFIYKRTFGKDANQTAEYVQTVVSVMKEEGMGSALKHFPGYGQNIDTHTDIAIDNRAIDQFRDNDFVPFKAGIQAGADSVLVSHTIIAAIDDAMPASLSKKVHTILREELQFDGLIMTDDLQMQAINHPSAAVLAVQAGNDLIVTSDYEIQIPQVIAAVKSGEIAEELINQAVLRILNYKNNKQV